MKTTLTLILFLIWITGVGQYFGSSNIKFEPVITDSVVWRIISISVTGDTTCNHEWVYSEARDVNPGYGCLVLHYGFHCSEHDLIRSRICRKCFRKENQREFWYQHRQKHILTEYEVLEDSLKKIKQ